MAMTMSGLLFIGFLATLSTLGLFVEVADRWTHIAISFLAVILWGLFGMSAFDVIVRETAFADASEPIEPLVWLGIGMAFIVALYAFYELVYGFQAAYEEADMSL